MVKGVLTFNLQYDFSTFIIYGLFQVAETFTFTLNGGHQHAHHHDHAHDHDHGDQKVNALPVLKDVARLDNCVTVIDAVNFDATFKSGDFLRMVFNLTSQTQSF